MWTFNKKDYFVTPPMAREIAEQILQNGPITFGLGDYRYYLDDIERALIDYRNAGLEEAARMFVCRDVYHWKPLEIIKLIRSLKAKES